LDQALGDAAQWRRQGIDIPVAVNLFPPLLGDANLPVRIFDALARHELPGDSLIIEITEETYFWMTSTEPAMNWKPCGNAVFTLPLTISAASTRL
jgi:EAL domain-containing protein (putative c-di-GMP-specific phosphodiesterase class I)